MGEKTVFDVILRKKEFSQKGRGKKEKKKKEKNRIPKYY